MRTTLMMCVTLAFSYLGPVSRAEGAAPPRGGGTDLSRLGISSGTMLLVDYRPHFGALPQPDAGFGFGWSPFPGKEVDPLALTTGFVLSLEENGPLAKAGFRSGDILTRIGGEELNTHNMGNVGVEKLLAKELAKQGHVSLRIRHFREGFWLDRKALEQLGLEAIRRQQAARWGFGWLISPDSEAQQKPWYEDREVVIILVPK